MNKSLLTRLLVMVVLAMGGIPAPLLRGRHECPNISFARHSQGAQWRGNYFKPTQLSNDLVAAVLADV